MTQPYDGAGRYEPASLGRDDPSTAEQAKQQAAGVAGEAKAQAAGVAEDAKAQVGRVAEQAKGEARDVAEHAKQEARGLLGQAQGELSSQAGTQQQRLAGLMRTLSEELGGILDPNNTDYRQGMVTDLAHQASGRLTNATSWLENREPADVLHEVSRFARRRPGTFLALAGLAGLVVGRLSRGMADDARESNQSARAYGDVSRQGYYGDYGAGYPAPMSPATYNTSATYGRQGYVDDTASAYAMEAGAAAPAYDEVTGMPVGTTPGFADDLGAVGTGLGTDGRRLPPVAEAETTYTPQVGTPTSEDRR